VVTAVSEEAGEHTAAAGDRDRALPHRSAGRDSGGVVTRAGLARAERR
jgi:hypothetical protein